MVRGNRIDLEGYRGTVVELTCSIPDTCLHVESRGQPGFLVFWDYFDGDLPVPYPETLSREQAGQVNGEALQWVPATAHFLKV